MRHLLCLELVLHRYSVLVFRDVDYDWYLLALLPWAEGGIWEKGEVLQGNVVCSNVNLFILHIGRKVYGNPCELPVDLIM